MNCLVFPLIATSLYMVWAQIILDMISILAKPPKMPCSANQTYSSQQQWKRKVWRHFTVKFKCHGNIPPLPLPQTKRLHRTQHLQGCGPRKITRNPKVPNHEILGAQHLSLIYVCWNIVIHGNRTLNKKENKLSKGCPKADYKSYITFGTLVLLEHSLDLHNI